MSSQWKREEGLVLTLREARQWKEVGRLRSASCSRLSSPAPRESNRLPGKHRPAFSAHSEFVQDGFPHPSVSYSDVDVMERGGLGAANLSKEFEDNTLVTPVDLRTPHGRSGTQQTQQIHAHVCIHTYTNTHAKKRKAM